MEYRLKGKQQFSPLLEEHGWPEKREHQGRRFLNCSNIRDGARSELAEEGNKREL